MEGFNNEEIAFIVRDNDGNIKVDQNGYITCISEGGMEFQLLYNEIDFNKDALYCEVDNKSVYIKIQNENVNTNNIQEDIIIHDKEIVNWTEASTKLFLSLYKEKIKLVNERKIKNKRLLWQKIAEDMNFNNYKVTNLQVENKFKSLERAYKNMLSNNKKTGRGRASCPYEKELTDILGKKHSIEPLIVSGNKGTVLRDNRTPLLGRELENKFETFCNDTDSENIEPTPGPSSKNNDLLKPNTHVKRQIGATAQMLQACQNNIKELTENIKKDKAEKLEIQKQILLEYREMRVAYEKSLKSIEEQLVIANNLRAERNELLKSYIEINKNK